MAWFGRKKAGVSLDIPREKEVLLNGQRFTCRLSDLDVMELMLALEKRAAEIAPDDAEAVVAVARGALAAVELMLGEDAWRRLTGDVPLPLLDALRLVGEIAVQVMAP